jgi:hydroxymethylglutaryl-CoA lyase
MHNGATRTVEIVEVGPRDGLQNENRPIPAADKIRLIDMLSDCGFRRVEAASFVSAKWVPQMADSAEVMAGIARPSGVRFLTLTPNLKGYERARAAGTDEVAVFASASEGFSRANINATIAESLERFAPVVAAAREDGVPVRGYVSCVAVCPYDGPTPPASVARVTEALIRLGCTEVSLGDTTGRATPEAIDAMLSSVLDIASPERLAGHFHDTVGRALDNIAAALERGISTFDAAAGGLGGCPYAPGARGNVATEAAIDMLEARGLSTGIDRGRLSMAAEFARQLRSHDREL